MTGPNLNIENKVMNGVPQFEISQICEISQADILAPMWGFTCGLLRDLWL